MNGISTKVSAATLGAALSTLVWTLLAAFVGPVSDMSPEALTGVTGATAVLAAFGFGFLVKETATSATPIPSAALTISPATISPYVAAAYMTGYDTTGDQAAAYGGRGPDGEAWDHPSKPPSGDSL